MNHRQAPGEDLQEIKELLDINKLPSGDFEEHVENFIVIEEKRKIIGVGGLEIYGVIGLVRSIVVESAYRGRGISKNIYKLIEKKAHGFGVNTLYLLTESATDYFNKLGFVIQEREKVPKLIKDTKQYKELCPSSAVVMSRKLSGKKGGLP